MCDRTTIKVAGALLAVLLPSAASRGEVCESPSAVPPTLEIEVLDPNADPNGTPAIELHKNPTTGEYQVDIPPVVLVLRYYYSGDRSFQGPMFPGGPSIVVVNHPRTGEQVYVPVEMMPGAPRVTYTRRKIEFDYGDHGISIVFCELFCTPVVKYRNRQKVKTCVEETVQSTRLPMAANRIKTTTRRIKDKCQTAVDNAAMAAHCSISTASIPLQQISRALPFGQWILNPTPDQATGAAAAQYFRDVDVRAASRDSFLEGSSISTLR